MTAVAVPKVNVAELSPKVLPAWVSVVVDTQEVDVPPEVVDHVSFRRWFRSDAFPERVGRIAFFLGRVWVDMSKEQVFSHNQVKQEIGRSLGNVVKSAQSGRYFPDGMLLSHPEVGFSVQPDGLFASTKSLESGRLRLVPGAREGYVELEGTPDMTLEIVSASSKGKDTVTLLDLYWRAGIREYWLVDARGAEVKFNIYRHTAKGYVPMAKRGGWIKSGAFGKSFRLTVGTDGRGDPEYTLEVK
jgi:Uma2 family endonuclease